MSNSELTVETLKTEATKFAKLESSHDEPTIYGTTDGKAVGTYLEHKFRAYLAKRYAFDTGNSAKGVDFPSIDVDMKVTSINQPQSSCPFKSARQKVCGLGYSLLVFVYEKTDNHTNKTARLNIQHAVFVEAERTADYTITRILREHLKKGANAEDLVAVFQDRNLPLDDTEALALAKDLLKKPPEQGYLTISNALQWRLQYARVITEAGKVSGVIKL